MPVTVDAELPSPFLKWAGGKRALVDRILKLAPSRMRTYYEPFVGAGAVFFALAAERRFERAVLSDINDELVSCYRALRDHVRDVIVALRDMPYARDAYYEIRSWEPSRLASPLRAARTIYLNRAGFNGLYRVNRRGAFNVPFGRHKNPAICNEPRLLAAARALQGVELRVADFDQVLACVAPGDFVYLDPPYVPLSKTARFTSYAASPFGPDEQERLAARLRILGAGMVPAVLSNADCAETRRLYKKLPQERVPVRRAINVNPERRGPVGELLVRSFGFGPATSSPRASGGSTVSLRRAAGSR